MRIDADTVESYIEQVPENRKEAFVRLRQVVLSNLPTGFEEVISYSMPSYVVPHSRYPAGYHCDPRQPLPFISLASQKHFIAYYHMGIYSKPDMKTWFEDAWAGLNIGKLDMGKSCIRLKNIQTIPFDLLGKLTTKISMEEWIAYYDEKIRR